MSLDTFLIAAQSENEVSDSCISELETLIAQILLFLAQILLFVDCILKEEIAMSIEVIDSFSVYNRSNVREALVEIACATLVMMLSLTELRFERFKLKISLSCREAHSSAVMMSDRIMLNYLLLSSKKSSIWSN